MARPWESQYAWGRDVDEMQGSDDEQLDYESLSADVAAQEFCDYLVLLKHSGALSAKQCCILAFWSTRAGVNNDTLKRMGYVA